MIRTIIESPFGTRADGSRVSPEEFARNVGYLHRCIADSLSRGEAPFASHGLYPLVLDDATPRERKQGMDAGYAWAAVAQRVAVYVDHGVTAGMRDGIARHRAIGLEVVERTIGE